MLTGRENGVPEGTGRATELTKMPALLDLVWSGGIQDTAQDLETQSGRETAVQAARQSPCRTIQVGWPGQPLHKRGQT